MKRNVKQLKTLARWYFAILGIALGFILLAGLLTDYPSVGPLVAVIGLGAGLVANVLAIFVIPIKALTLK